MQCITSAFSSYLSHAASGELVYECNLTKIPGFYYYCRVLFLMTYGKCRTVSDTLNETVSLLSCRTSLHCKRENLWQGTIPQKLVQNRSCVMTVFRALTYLKGLFGTNSTLECCAASWQPRP